MKNLLFALWDVALEIAVCLWVDIQNAFRRFRKKKIQSFDETEVYDNPKMIDNGRKQKSKIHTTSGSNLTHGVDKDV